MRSIPRPRPTAPEPTSPPRRAWPHAAEPPVDRDQVRPPLLAATRLRAFPMNRPTRRVPGPGMTCLLVKNPPPEVAASRPQSAPPPHEDETPALDWQLTTRTTPWMAGSQLPPRGPGVSKRIPGFSLLWQVISPVARTPRRARGRGWESRGRAGRSRWPLVRAPRPRLPAGARR